MSPLSQYGSELSEEDVSVGGREQSINAVVSSSAPKRPIVESEYFIASKWIMFLLFLSFISAVMVVRQRDNLPHHADAYEEGKAA